MFRIAALLAVLIWFVHLITLPVGISYDGHIYIDLADILGSERFPGDWHPARTPLYPLSLKLSFLLFGRQPLAAILVSSVPALVGILATGLWLRRMAGPRTAASVMIALSLYPTLVVYQHMVLTETGTFCVITCVMAIAICMRPSESRKLWMKSVLIGAMLAVAYYWRQNLLSLVPLFVITHVLQGGRSKLRQSATQAAVIVVIPLAASLLWRPFTGDDSLARLMLRFGVAKQALLPPEDPMVTAPDVYRQAIQDSTFEGSFYGGIRANLASNILENVIRWPNEPPREMFWRLIRRYPGRYASGVGRTTLLLAGAPGGQNENDIFREQMLFGGYVGSRIGDGPAAVDSANKQQFIQHSTDSLVLKGFRMLAPLYAALTLPAVVLTCAALFVAIFLRNPNFLLIAAVPVFYIAPYALTLSSVDRYGFPVHPACFAGAAVTGTAVFRIIRSRVAKAVPQHRETASA